MDDIIGFRIVCQTLTDVENFGVRLESGLGARLKNYLVEEHGAKIGYRAIHGIVRFHQPLQERQIQVRFEIQIRTWYQHLWACWCESHGEQAKEGFANAAGNDDAEEQKRELRAYSNEIKNWEISYPKEVQEVLPYFSGPYNVAIAWIHSKNNYGFEPYFSDTGSAVNFLNHLERQSGIQPLLLVGIADEPKLRTLLTQTHPNFTSGSSLHPRHWLPQ